MTTISSNDPTRPAVGSIKSAPVEMRTWTSMLDAAPATRIAFWTEHLERSRRLLEAMQRSPVSECGEGFASIPNAAADAKVEMLFSTTPIAGNLKRIFHIRRSLIPALLRIAREMNERGWILKIEDGYRTQAMQTALGRAPAVLDAVVRMCVWESGQPTPPLDLVFQRARCLVANLPCTGTHLCGAAVDVSVFRRDGAEVSRGAPYLTMSEVTPMDSPFVMEDEHRNRREITRLMECHGFLHYPGEFWHYNQGDALQQILTASGKHGIYGPVHWDTHTNEVTPYTDVHSPLTPPGLLQQLVAEALERLNQNR